MSRSSLPLFPRPVIGKLVCRSSLPRLELLSEPPPARLLALEVFDGAGLRAASRSLLSVFASSLFSSVNLRTRSLLTQSSHLLSGHRQLEPSGHLRGQRYRNTAVRQHQGLTLQLWSPRALQTGSGFRVESSCSLWLLLAVALAGLCGVPEHLRALGSMSHAPHGPQTPAELSLEVKSVQQQCVGPRDPYMDFRMDRTTVCSKISLRSDIHEDMWQFGLYLRVLPAFVVDIVHDRALFVVGFGVFRIEDLGFVQQLSVEAKDLLVFDILCMMQSWKRCHGGPGSRLSRSCSRRRGLWVRSGGETQRHKRSSAAATVISNVVTLPDACFRGLSRYVQSMDLRARVVDGLAALRIGGPRAWHRPGRPLACLPRTPAPSGASTWTEAASSTLAQLQLDGPAAASRPLCLCSFQSPSEPVLRQELVLQVSLIPYYDSSRADSGERGDHFALDSHARSRSRLVFLQSLVNTPDPALSHHPLNFYFLCSNT